MENKINVAELLKDCPSGMELDCTIYEDVYFVEIGPTIDYPIRIKTKSGLVILLTKYGQNVKRNDAKCVIFPKGKTTWEGFIPPCKFKEGDIAISNKGDIHLLRTKNSSYCAYRKRWEGLSTFDNTITTSVRIVRLATEEEKQKLFQAIKDNGYRWNPETKTLEKLIEPKFKVGDRIRHKVTNKDDVYEISKVYDDSYGLVGFTWMLYMKYQDQYELVPNKFDITTLVPFESRVLVRAMANDSWRPAIFGCVVTNNSCPYVTLGGVCWAQCIPYEGNEHLLSKTDECDDFYKTWGGNNGKD